ncbi:LOW QUALITY PROTEIN: receptor-like protein kinase FERONIA [Corylus avellana]|uniref:LOW QUALITY PROTEIN: receptor-like protein kinase FERONIA n=1 Tax=Corylus avellana TaxID=13451 RepID=UPI00286A58E2|nr:LOW QUALITY PROTEIN: receptor-like protein kinase FERONIA [Corylus avellana]
MHSLALYLSFLHLLLITQVVTETPPPYAATDYFLLNCGSSSDSTSLDGRNWDGDLNSKFSPPNIETTSIASTPSQHNPSVTQVPYTTARIFHNKFTYSFPVSPGLKFVRLYFFPASYAGLDESKSFSLVTANNFTLLSNFSAFLAVSSSKPLVASVIKEFIVPVLRTQFLNITFIPSPSSYAFINGIEIVSMPNNLYMHNRDDVMITMVDYNIPFYFDETTALETMYRLNVGGNDISGEDDTGMFRTWRQDSQYLFGQMKGMIAYSSSDVKIQYTTDTPAYTAPEIVYKTSRTMDLNPTVNLNSNLTWIFTVDGGFNYLFRLHFCETLKEVVKRNQRVFKIFINNQTAEADVDVINWSGGNGIPVYREYVVFFPSGNKAKQDLWLALHPDWDMSPLPAYASAILNGVEIFKLNRSDGSLAGINPEVEGVTTLPAPEPKTKLTERPKKLSPTVAIIIGGVVGPLLILFLVTFRLSKRAKDIGSNGETSWWGLFSFTKTKSTKTQGSSLPSELCRKFSFAEIKAATNDFDKVLIIGVGGFGNVYKGYIDDGTISVAIKRLKSSSQQGAHEFRTEIVMLSQLRYLHLVSLIGYCNEGDEMILIYDYMARGTLRDHLYNTNNPPLPWKQRLEICIGAARALNYLHTGAKQTIIHRDVKTTNILLDEKWVAKVSDFGLSKVGPTGMANSHVSTVVKGSFGYMDPEYYRRMQLTAKSDVYSFGVVLCEVLCARPPIMRTTEIAMGLARWAQEIYRNEKVEEMVDSSIKGEIGIRCLKKFVEIAMNCLLDNGIERPSMDDVLWGLEFALQLQESVDEDVGLNVVEIDELDDEKGLFPKSTLDDSDDMSSSSSGQVSSRNSNSRVTIMSNGEQSFASASQDSGKLMSSSPGTVFSMIMNLSGR